MILSRPNGNWIQKASSRFRIGLDLGFLAISMLVKNTLEQGLPRKALNITNHALKNVLLGSFGERRCFRLVSALVKRFLGRQISQPAVRVSEVKRMREW